MRVFQLFLLCLHIYSAVSFTFINPSSKRRLCYPLSIVRVKPSSALKEFNGSDAEGLELQSDTSLYGRGEMHLSAVLNEGDIVIYQTGCWEVDSVRVGDGEETVYEYGIVDTIQIVWTHNCEHGFIRGMKVDIDHESGKLSIVEPFVFIDFGPEQLVARVSVDWENENNGSLKSPLPLELHNKDLE